MFKGFTGETIDFLWGIRLNNNREWFEAHKEIYLTQLYRPMVEMADEVFEFLHDARPDYGLARKVTRIYRDTRRLFGRGPYKDGLWFCVDQPSEDWRDKPTFYFDIDPDYYSYGLGDVASPSSMAKLRARMERDPKPLEKLVRALERQEEFAAELPQYKRPKGTAPSKLLEPWYQARNFSVVHKDGPSDELFSRDIVERVKRGFSFLLPFYDYFVTLASDPAPGDSN